MGNTCDPGDTRMAQVEARIKKDREESSRRVRLLMLGTGESGKSTVVKQLKVLHTQGFSLEERKMYTRYILHNVVEAFDQLKEGALKLNVTWTDIELELLRQLDAPGWREHIKTKREQLVVLSDLWNTHSTMHVLWERRAEIQVNDSAAYFLDRLGFIMSPDYVPSTHDIIRARVRTMGVWESEFELSGYSFVVVDVGGQRSERRKWIHCFQEVNAIIFCSAISEFDQTLFEDETVNRVEESMNLFKETINSKWFDETPIILFLNKVDLFQQKLMRGVSIDCCWKDYKGGNDFQQCTEYIRDEFLGLNLNPRRKVHVHLTQATDQSSIAFVIEAVREIVIQEILQLTGYM